MDYSLPDTPLSGSLSSTQRVRKSLRRPKSEDSRGPLTVSPSLATNAAFRLDRGDDDDVRETDSTAVEGRGIAEDDSEAIAESEIVLAHIAGRGMGGASSFAEGRTVFSSSFGADNNNVPSINALYFDEDVVTDNDNDGNEENIENQQKINPNVIVIASEKPPSAALKSKQQPTVPEIQLIIRTLETDASAWTKRRWSLLRLSEMLMGNKDERQQCAARDLRRLAPLVARCVESPQSQVALAALECVESVMDSSAVEPPTKAEFARELVVPALTAASSLVHSGRTVSEAGMRAAEKMLSRHTSLSLREMVYGDDALGSSRNVAARRNALELLSRLMVSISSSHDAPATTTTTTTNGIEEETRKRRASEIVNGVVRYLGDADPSIRAKARETLAALFRTVPTLASTTLIAHLETQHELQGRNGNSDEDAFTTTTSNALIHIRTHIKQFLSEFPEVADILKPTLALAPNSLAGDETTGVVVPDNEPNTTIPAPFSLEALEKMRKDLPRWKMERKMGDGAPSSSAKKPQPRSAGQFPPLSASKKQIQAQLQLHLQSLLLDPKFAAAARAATTPNPSRSVNPAIAEVEEGEALFLNDSFGANSAASSPFDDALLARKRVRDLEMRKAAGPSSSSSPVGDALVRRKIQLQRERVVLRSGPQFDLDSSVNDDETTAPSSPFGEALLARRVANQRRDQSGLEDASTDSLPQFYSPPSASSLTNSSPVGAKLRERKVQFHHQEKKEFFVNEHEIFENPEVVDPEIKSLHNDAVRFDRYGFALQSTFILLLVVALSFAISDLVFVRETVRGESARLFSISLPETSGGGEEHASNFDDLANAVERIGRDEFERALTQEIRDALVAEVVQDVSSEPEAAEVISMVESAQVSDDVELVSQHVDTTTPVETVTEGPSAFVVGVFIVGTSSLLPLLVTHALLFLSRLISTYPPNNDDTRAESSTPSSLHLPVTSLTVSSFEGDAFPITPPSRPSAESEIDRKGRFEMVEIVNNPKTPGSVKVHSVTRSRRLLAKSAERERARATFEGSSTVSTSQQIARNAGRTPARTTTLNINAKSPVGVDGNEGGRNINRQQEMTIPIQIVTPSTARGTSRKRARAEE